MLSNSLFSPLTEGYSLGGYYTKISSALSVFETSIKEIKTQTNNRLLAYTSVRSADKLQASQDDTAQVQSSPVTKREPGEGWQNYWPSLGLERPHRSFYICLLPK